jgi:hypothetical protein
VNGFAKTFCVFKCLPGLLHRRTLLGSQKNCSYITEILDSVDSKGTTKIKEHEFLSSQILDAMGYGIFGHKTVDIWHLNFD